jgi:hypothetical protein
VTVAMKPQDAALDPVLDPVLDSELDPELSLDVKSFDGDQRTEVVLTRPPLPCCSQYRVEQHA